MTIRKLNNECLRASQPAIYLDEQAFYAKLSLFMPAICTMVLHQIIGLPHLLLLPWVEENQPTLLDWPTIGACPNAHTRTYPFLIDKSQNWYRNQNGNNSMIERIWKMQMTTVMMRMTMMLTTILMKTTEK